MESIYGPKIGLYDPAYEKDACGVGIIADINGQSSHQIIKDGIEALERMSHRGACGCDPESGDGAGLSMAVPDKFFRRVLLHDLGIELPSCGKYAVGIVFFPQDYSMRQQCKKHVEGILLRFNLQFLTWRKVPTNNQWLGATSRNSEPFLEQVFVQSPEGISETEFEKILFLARRTFTRGAPSRIYACSFSSRTIIYKGQLKSEQVNSYFTDLGQRDFESHFVIAHSRFSTNTFPSWERAQPLRCVAHNGEINTLRGNINWMKAREGAMKSSILGNEELKNLFPVLEADVSDSGSFDNVVELLSHAGRSIEESVLMMIPEPWQMHEDMDSDRQAFYEYQSNLMEPWDGPALMAFTDGVVVGAVLDRNGLRPGRFWLTNSGKVIVASEVGVLDVPEEDIVQKGRLAPGEMFLVDFHSKRIVSDKEIKSKLIQARPYRTLLRDHRINVETSQEEEVSFKSLTQDRAKAFQSFFGPSIVPPTIMEQLKMFGYNRELIEMILGPMTHLAYEALGSMGNDSALPVLSPQPHRIFDYFQQMFAQVTNPPIDPIREEIVMSLQCPIGPEFNLLEPSDHHCARINLLKPILGPTGFLNLTRIKRDGWAPSWIDMTWPLSEGPEGLEKSLKRICLEAQEHVIRGAKMLVLTDRLASNIRVPVPSLLALGATHHTLVEKGLRSQVALIVACGDACEVHHHCLLLGFGCDACYPRGVFEACDVIQQSQEEKLSRSKMVTNYLNATHKGMLKVIAKMGISTIQSYKGAQIFEAVGVGPRVIDMCFAGCASRIAGCDFTDFAEDCIAFHRRAYPLREETEIANLNLGSPGEYHWRNGIRAEVHMNHPDAIALLQDASRDNNPRSFAMFSNTTNALSALCCIRGQFALKKGTFPIPLESVEPAREIVKRFSSGAMSYGSISIEAHSTLAVAMNRIGGKSNTGEGGEHISRYADAPDGMSARSAIKQIASGRFGVTIHYLTNADELQIKMAQGAKPGEGGELPGYKVVGEIAKTRHSTEGVGLISPPPHHDIYSIEDLSQLIFDLKNANPRARVSVKLVSEVGVGVVAAGVAKGMADHILISGHDGGTGASKWTGIKHAGLPFELGLAEAHQTLVKNGLRSRVTLQTDGQLKTGLDIVKAALLGAEEFCMATAPLIAMGCIMMRKCHLNTCPVGIATQDPALRRMFTGQPEHVVNYMFLLAEEIRGYMAGLGISKFVDLVGRSDLMEQVTQSRVKTRGLDFTDLLLPASTLNPGHPMSCVDSQDHALNDVLDRQIIKRVGRDILAGKKIRADFLIKNTDRSTGAILSHEITKKFGMDGLPDDTIHLRFRGSAGQSFGVFLAAGICMELSGDANDYVGKGLSGGTLIIYPPKSSNFKSEKNMIVGNVCLYGATSGHAFFSGKASQRFAVRNSGATAVVEAVGDHACEYMTGGYVVILGTTGRNFAAGMSGGIAYVYDKDKTFNKKVNHGLVQLEEIDDTEEEEFLKHLIDQHRALTGSSIADRIIWDWDHAIKNFVKVIPTDYKRVLEKQKNMNVSTATEKKLPEEKIATNTTATLVPKAQDIEDIKAPRPFQKPQRPVAVAKPKKLRGFIEYDRRTAPYRNAEERIKDLKEIYTEPDPSLLKTQAARCMDCGVPFCHQETTGCPLGNKIPEWNQLVYDGKWKEALDRLLETNNFPEFTGRVCPAPCEGACVLGITEEPVTIKMIECQIIDKGFEMGWIVPEPPNTRTGKQVAVIGSGPAGLAVAHQLNKAGHLVTVFERADRPGGLLMYGVPNMKLDKKLVVERRIDLLKKEGITFKCNVAVGSTVKLSSLRKEFDAVVLSCGSTKARKLTIPGSNLKGIHLAMDYLHPATKSYLDSQMHDRTSIDVANKSVVVIGGGDTGNDCIGTAARLGAKSVVNFELLPKPPKQRAGGNPWPQWPRVFRVEYGHAEVAAKYGEDPRQFSTLTKKFVDDGKGNVSAIETVQIAWTKDSAGGWAMQEIEGSQVSHKADVVFLSMGFTGVEGATFEDVPLELDKLGNIKAGYGQFKSTEPGVFACGDCRRGQSLVVWAIAEGRQCAREVDKFLMGSSTLP